MYEKIPALKETVSQYLTYFQKEDIDDINDVEFIHGEGVVFFEDDRGILRVPFEGDGDVKCRSFDDEVSIRDCRLDNDELLVSLRRDDYPGSGPFTFGVHTDDGAFFVETTLLWYEDLQEHLSRNKKAYMAAHGLQTASNESEKIEDRIDLDEVEELMNDDVKVLLYEVTAEYNTWQLACDDGCDVEVDGDVVVRNTNAVLVTQQGEALTISSKGTTVEGKSVEIQNNGEFIEITNYPRGANGLAYNIFRGNLRIEKEVYNNLVNGMTEDFVVINDVPFEDYLHGIAETSEKQEDEKLKTIAMLVKNYALFYLKGTNPHPSIPEDASYNAVDDPRIFQKYVGAGFESYGKKRHDALRETEDVVILYDGYLPILPYFHCSAGFTRSGKEKR